MSSSEPGFKLTTTQWLVCIIAAIGFAFDIYELLMLPLIIKPAMAALSVPLIELRPVPHGRLEETCL
jgi:uncharacterized membrane protein (DUF2068 family)